MMTYHNFPYMVMIVYVENNYISVVKLKLNMYEHWEGLIVQQIAVISLKA